MTRKPRIELEDSPFEAFIKMSEGNPGALKVCMDMYKDGGNIDPQVMMGGLGCILLMDTYGIYSHRIWMLYKDVCVEDLVKTIAVIRACQLGLLSEDMLNEAIDNHGKGVDVDKLLVDVKTILEDFGKKE